MKAENRLEALELIEEYQRNGGSIAASGGCSSVEVRIGGTSPNGQVQHDTLYLIDAPAAIVDELRDHGFSVSITEDGAFVKDHGKE